MMQLSSQTPLFRGQGSARFSLEKLCVCFIPKHQFKLLVAQAASQYRLLADRWLLRLMELKHIFIYRILHSQPLYYVPEAFFKDLFRIRSVLIISFMSDIGDVFLNASSKSSPVDFACACARTQIRAQTCKRTQFEKLKNISHSLIELWKILIMRKSIVRLYIFFFIRNKN